MMIVTWSCIWIKSLSIIRSMKYSHKGAIYSREDYKEIIPTDYSSEKYVQRLIVVNDGFNELKKVRRILHLT